MYEGKDEKALEMTRAILKDRGPDEFPGNRFLLAYLERVTGRPGPLQERLRRCTEKDGPAQPGERPPGASCRDLIFWVSRRNVALRGAKTPPVFANLLIEAFRAEPTNWPMRATSIRDICHFAPDLAWQEANDLLSIPATLVPLGARLDAIGAKARVALNRKAFDTADTLYQDFLNQLRYHPPPVTAEIWPRLTSVPATSAPYDDWSYQDSPSDVTWVLASRVGIAIQASKTIQARRALERYLQATLDLATSEESETFFDLKTLPVEQQEVAREYLEREKAKLGEVSNHETRVAREYLAQIANLELQQGHKADARRIAGYLLTQPVSAGPRSGWLVSVLAELRKPDPNGAEPPEIKPAAAPWEPEKTAVTEGRSK
jgi:hypothetical protein